VTTDQTSTRDGRRLHVERHGTGSPTVVLGAAHRARADSLPKGRHVIAEASSHYVPFTEPGVVVDEVLRVIDQD